MSSLDKAVETQLKNIQAKTGKSLEELSAAIRNSGLAKHGEIRAMVMRDFGLGYGDANSLVHYALQSDGERAAQAQEKSMAEIINELYTGPKASLRPIHDRLMAEIEAFGPYETLPKKGYLSLRRKKQFAMVGPATNTRVEVGLNVKDLPAHPRLAAQPTGSMCNYKVKIADPQEVDEELFSWIRQAYEGAG